MNYQIKYSLIFHAKTDYDFWRFTSADIFVIRLLQLQHQAYNSILRKNR